MDMPHIKIQIAKISLFLNSLPKFIIYLINNEDFRIHFSQYIKSLDESFINKFDYYLSKRCIPFGSVCNKQFEIEREKIINNFIYISKYYVVLIHLKSIILSKKMIKK